MLASLQQTNELTDSPERLCTGPRPLLSCELSAELLAQNSEVMPKILVCERYLACHDSLSHALQTHYHIKSVLPLENCSAYDSL